MDKIVGKIIFRADVENISPMLIASGENDEFDFTVIRNCAGKPVIPASGFAGMLRESFKQIREHDGNNGIESLMEYFWGTDKTDTQKTIQSHIIIDDLVLKNDEFKVCERDGVGIDHETMLAVDRSKYNYELLEPGAVFSLNIELTVREEYKKHIDTLTDFLHFIGQKGCNEYYRQGAFKTNGFGILKFSEIEIFKFDFPDDNKNWFNFLEEKTTPENIYKSDKKLSFEVKPDNILRITGRFSLKNSLIIRADIFSADNELDLDKTHLKNSIGKPVISAKSIRGAVRHRALKILKTLEYNEPDKIVNSLFGYVGKSKKEANKGRLTTFETIVENVDATQVQPRIKIDRFTGGTIEGALMQSQPIWHKDEEIELRFEIKDYKEKEAGLMLLVMKDLMCEDLPVGGEKSIGRGVLVGELLKIEGLNGENTPFEFDKQGLINPDTDKIKAINALVSEIIPKN